MEGSIFCDERMKISTSTKYIACVRNLLRRINALLSRYDVLYF